MKVTILNFFIVMLSAKIAQLILDSTAQCTSVQSNDQITYSGTVMCFVRGQKGTAQVKPSSSTKAQHPIMAK